MNVYDFAVWATQGGGLVRESALSVFIFITKPDCPGLAVGDRMPSEWSVVPANSEARAVDSMVGWGGIDQAEFEAGVEELFNGLFSAMEAGRTNLGQVGNFFPDEVRERCS